MTGRIEDLEIRPAREEDLPAITAIFNYAIDHTTAAWTEEPVSEANRRVWLEDHRQRGLLVIVAQADGLVLGFGALSVFRDWPGYCDTVENSVYVHPKAWSKGVGSQLLAQLIKEAAKCQKHSIVAAISADNQTSIDLHQKMGFSWRGALPEVGIKAGKRLNLAFLTYTFAES
ncbi:N-acetyltransferase family protein [Peptococcus simiae]|uniref:N-acetyltransferase family protein n=1 Tax=Peptococcus simiae TaxID=1643805 RepID=A0ABW9GXG8_9FIRM